MDATRVRRGFFFPLLVALLATACGSPSTRSDDDGAGAAVTQEAHTPAPLGAEVPCRPSGTTVSVVVPRAVAGLASFRFRQECLAAPAGEEFRVELANKSGTNHNLSIYTDASAGEEVFLGRIIAGGEKITYEVTAIERAGLYFFRCDLHPEAMTGTFVVA